MRLSPYCNLSPVMVLHVLVLLVICFPSSSTAYVTARTKTVRHSDSIHGVSTLFQNKRNIIGTVVDATSSNDSDSRIPITSRKRQNLSGSPSLFSRCQVIKKLKAFSFFGSVVSSGGISAQSNQALALEPCRAKSRNCIRTVWTPPASKSSDDAIAELQNVITSYPANGQNGIDCNGWTLIGAENLASNDNYARVEYKSCVGPAAITINLGQPFVDDLKLEIENNGTVQVRSSSRMGSSDLFVNKKRVEYLGNSLRSKGWDIPTVSY